MWRCWNTQMTEQKSVWEKCGFIVTDIILRFDNVVVECFCLISCTSQEIFKEFIRIVACAALKKIFYLNGNICILSSHKIILVLNSIMKGRHLFVVFMLHMAKLPLLWIWKVVFPVLSIMTTMKKFLTPVSFFVFFF